MSSDSPAFLRLDYSIWKYGSGLLDIRVQWHAGVDFNRPSNPEDIETAVKAIRKTGVTAISAMP